MKIYQVLLVLLVLTACGPTTPNTDVGADASVEVDASTGPTDQEIMNNYEADVVAYQQSAGMPTGWWGDWMLDRRHDWTKAYVSGRRNSHDDVLIYVRYENPINYSPPWTSEAEHFGALKTMAELQYPGWSFTFVPYYDGAENDLQGNDAIAFLGAYGTSYASRHEIHLVWEGIFSHEFGHTVGLRHHYCNNNGGDHCPDAYPPGEGKCIMDRTSSSFGPTENTFLLLTNGDRKDDEIMTATENINGRYPPTFAAFPRDACSVKDDEYQ